VNTLSHQFASQGLHFFKVSKNVTHVAVARPRYLDMDATPVSDGIRKIVEFIGATPKCTRRKIIDALAPAPPAPAATVEVVPGSSESAPPVPAAELPSSPEVAGVNSDLHWLIHQGHVIEFANGILELARKPLPKPPRPEPKPTETKPAQTADKGPMESGITGAESASSETQVPRDAEAKAQDTVHTEAPPVDAESSIGAGSARGPASMTSATDIPAQADAPACAATPFDRRGSGYARL
jgi:hypothetical protein